MQDIRDFLKDACNELLKMYRIVQESPFIRTIARNITDRSNINVALESLILCLIYSINIILNFDDTTLRLTFVENIVLLLSYFSAYYFAPKRNFEFKTLALYLLAVVIASPVIIYSHSAQEIAKTYEFMLLASCIIGLVFRADVDESKKIPAMLVLERSLSQEQLNSFCARYQIVAIVTDDSSLSDQYRVFSNLKQATNWLNFIKIIPIFSVPIRLIYVHESDISKAVDVLNFANQFGLYAVNDELKPIDISEFAAKEPIAEESELAEVFREKRVLIEYDGNLVIKALVHQLSKFCNVTVSCTNPDHELSDIPRVVSRFAPIDVILTETGSVFDFVFALSCTHPRFFTEENINYAVGYNAIKYANIVGTCKSKSVKALFLISNHDAITANTWSGVSQRIAELYAQSAATTEKIMQIVPIRIPKTILDVQSDSATAFSDVSDTCNNLIKFICNIIRINHPSNKVYSIVPRKYLVTKEMMKLFDLSDKYVCNNVFPNINETLIQTEFDNVYSTEFSNDKPYDLEDVRRIMHSRSVIEVTERALRLLK